MHERVHRGLARSYQITSIFKRLSVLDNVALAVQAREAAACASGAPARAEMQRYAQAAAVARARGSGPAAASALAGALSHGEQRQLEVGMALATRPKLLLLDEPMAGMGPDESERMVDLLQSLRGETTLLLVEHDMDAVFRLADRISVLVSGRVIASGTPDEIRAASRGAARLSGRRFEECHCMSALLEVDGAGDGLRHQPGAVRRESCASQTGERGHAAGPQRHGQDHHGALHSGPDAAAQRQRALSRRAHRPVCSPDRIARMGLALVPEGRQIFPNLTVRENLLAFAANRNASRRPVDAGARVTTLFPRLAERARNMGNQLSGGEQQMLAIGRALMTNPHLLILDEATEGLAPLIREDIWRCLHQLARAGPDHSGDRQVRAASDRAGRSAHHHRARPGGVAGRLRAAGGRAGPLAALHWRVIFFIWPAMNHGRSCKLYREFDNAGAD